MITIEIQAEILMRFFNDKQSVRKIARHFGLHRSSVRRVIKRRSVLSSRQIPNRKSLLDPYRDEIKSILVKTPDCTAAAILNRCRSLGYLGGVTVLQQFVRTLKAHAKRPKEAFLRIEFSPGETAQVDWGEFGDVFSDGVKIHCFAMVLCYSRYIYLEFTRSEKFDEFIRCHENAFRYFGGAPKQCWYDNLATAVTDRMGSLIKFNTRFMAYMGHHGIRPHACNVARGNEKGRVEDLIKYIRTNFWPGRRFVNFEDLQKQEADWRNQIANQREHRSTRRIVRLMFETDEQKILMPLNPNRYDTDEIISRVVPPDFHLPFESNRYSVPWTLVGMTITLRIGPDQIKCFYHERSVTTHTRSYLKNKVFTHDAHRQGLLERKPAGQKEVWQLAAVKNIGPKMMEYIDLLRTGRRSLRHELGRLLALSTVYGDNHVHDACKELLNNGIVGVESLELTLKRMHHPSETTLLPAPMSFNNQKLNRIVPVVDLRRYDALLFDGDIDKSALKNVEENHGNKPQ